MFNLSFEGWNFWKFAQIQYINLHTNTNSPMKDVPIITTLLPAAVGAIQNKE